jgi:transcriptional repressor NrdR
VRCPYCGHGDTRVLESRAFEEDRAVRRRRECATCLRRFTTYERVEDQPLVVVKRDGRREAFDRRKILVGLIKACEKRPVSTETLEGVVRSVERELRESGEKEIESTAIGEQVMARLRDLDPVAYVRFASVYRQFTDLSHFQDELEKLLHEGRNHTPSGDRPQGAETGAARPGGTDRADLRQRPDRA